MITQFGCKYSKKINCDLIIFIKSRQVTSKRYDLMFFHTIQTVHTPHVSFSVLGGVLFF